MDLRILAIITVSYLYGFFEVFLNLRQKRRSKTASSGDKGSLWLLYGLITLGYTLAFSIGATTIGRIHSWDAFFGIGMAVVAAGLAVRIYSILTLKQFFTYSVTTVEDQKIIETGLYKLIRHPGYLGQLMIFLGISISISNWLSVLAMMIPVTAGYRYRMRIEEKYMAEQLGEEYLNYQKRTKRIIPTIY
jgi:protein-S-isoprenylcysteine O-methyltransferase Ste14